MKVFDSKQNVHLSSFGAGLAPQCAGSRDSEPQRTTAFFVLMLHIKDIHPYLSRSHRQRQVESTHIENRVLIVFRVLLKYQTLQERRVHRSESCDRQQKQDRTGLVTICL